MTTTRTLPLLVLAGLLAALAFAGAPATAATTTYTNPNSIEIRDGDAADPYPAPIEVRGPLGERITDVAVSLRGLTHPYESDIDMLLVSPSGDASILMSDACGGAGEAKNLTLLFS